MTFKLAVFIAILVAVAVLGTRGYRAAVRRFEDEHAALPVGDDGRAG
jgi:ABC-type Na+ efflux pump permease subunit